MKKRILFILAILVGFICIVINVSVCLQFGLNNSFDFPNSYVDLSTRNAGVWKEIRVSEFENSNIQINYGSFVKRETSFFISQANISEIIEYLERNVTSKYTIYEYEDFDATLINWYTSYADYSLTIAPASEMDGYSLVLDSNYYQHNFFSRILDCFLPNSWFIREYD